MESFAVKSKDQANEVCFDITVGQFTDGAFFHAKENNIIVQQTELNELPSQEIQTFDKELLSFPQKHTLPDNLLEHSAEHPSLKACPHKYPVLPTCNCRTTIVQPFKCGGCFKAYSTICKLHEHLGQVHRDSDMYFFDKVTQTAFPKYGSSCKVTQTDTEILHCGHINVLERNEDELIDTDLEVKRPCNDLAESAHYSDVKEASYFNESELEKKVESLDVQSIVASDVHVDHFSSQTGVIVKTEVHVADDGNLSRIGKSHSLSKKKNRKRARHLNVKRGKKKLKNVIMNKLQNNDIQNLKIDEKDIPIKCQQCTSLFTTRHLLRLHIEKEHGKKKVKHCEVCDKTLSSTNALKRHAAIHERDPSCTCDKCGKTFISSEKLSHHKAVKHSDEKNFMCDHCGEAFATISVLKIHKKKCLDIRPFVCPYENCGKSYRGSLGLKYHMRNHTGETPFICEVCGKGFTRSGTLTYHMRGHTGERPFKCDQCPKAFATTSRVFRHKKTHTQDKPLVCHCGKAFSNNWNLKAHMRQHTGEKPYSCNICGAGFTHNVSRKNHMKIH